MATVTNTVKLPDGSTPDRVDVVIELVASTTGRAAGWITATDVTLEATVRPTVTNGAWTTSLTPNVDITPSGSVYKVTEYVDKTRYTHYIEVGSGGGSLFDLLVDPPASLATAASELYADAAAAAAVAVHTADTSDAHDASAVSISDSAGLYSGSDVEAALAEVALASIPAQSALTLTAGAVTIPATVGRSVTISLTANATVTLETPTVSYRTLDVIFVQDSTGGRSVTWATSVVFPGGSADVSAAPSTRTRMPLVWDNGTWYERSVALPGQFAAPRRGNRAIIIGDSVASAVTNSTGFGAWFFDACGKSGQRVQFMRNAGTGGNTSTQMLSRFATDVIAYHPDVVVVAAVTPNDTSAAIPMATRKANIRAMVSAALADGCKVMLATSPPSDTLATLNELQAMNQWLIGFANRNGFHLIDLYSPLVDVNDGTYSSSYTSDGVHPTEAGRLVLGTSVAATFPSEYQTKPFLTVGLGDSTNLLPNGVFVGDANADGIADGWQKGSGGFSFASTSLAAMGGEGAGNWQIVGGNGTYSDLRPTVAPTGWSPGDKLAVGAKFQKDASVSAGVDIRVDNVSVGFGLLGGPTIAIGSTFYAYMEYTMPVGAVSLGVRIFVQSAVGTMRIGQFTMRNLTTLGIA